VTACDIEKFFKFDTSVEITSHVIVILTVFYKDYKLCRV